MKINKENAIYFFSNSLNKSKKALEAVTSRGDFNERKVKSTWKINCSLPFNNIKKNDSHLDQLQPEENIYQADSFGIEIFVINPFFILHNAVRKICDSANNLENMLFAFSGEYTDKSVWDLAVGLRIQSLFRAVIQSEISTIIRVFSILKSFFKCGTFFRIAAITFDRLLVLQLHLRYSPAVTTFRATGVVIFIWIFSSVNTLLLSLFSRSYIVLLVMVVSLLA